MKLLLKLGIIAPIISLSICSYYAYQYYLFDYRYKVEEKTELTTTNTDALRELSDVQETIEKYIPSEDVQSLTEENTYIIPGLIATKTLKDKKVDMCTSMTPQGICTTESFVIISAYCHTHEHNSVLYVLSKEDHDFIGEVVVNGKYHLGNICYDRENQTIWCAAKGNNPLTGGKCAYLNSINLDDLLIHLFDQNEDTIKFSKKVPVTEYSNASFITYYKGEIFVGNYIVGENEKALVTRYPIDENGQLETKTVKGKSGKCTVAAAKEQAEIGGLCQGIYFTDKYISIMQSSGTKDSSIRYFYDTDYKKDVDEMIAFDELYKTSYDMYQSIENFDKKIKNVKSLSEEIQKSSKTFTLDEETLSKVLGLFQSEFDLLEQLRNLLINDTYNDTEYNKLMNQLTSIKEQEEKLSDDIYSNIYDAYLKNNNTDDLTIKFITAFSEVQAQLLKYERSIERSKEAVTLLKDFDLDAYLERLEEVRTYNLNDDQAFYSVTLPPRLEQAMESSLDKGKMYILFESAAYAYRAQSEDFIDRVIVFGN